MVASITFKGSLSGDIFVLYVKYMLAPTLNVGDVVLMVNLLLQGVDCALDPIYECGVFVWFLFVYLPDFSPVEFVWLKVKVVLRGLRAGIFVELQKVL